MRKKNCDGSGTRPRVLMVSTFFEGHGGGLEIVASQFARELVEAGYSLDWIATDDPNPVTIPGATLHSLRGWNACEKATGLPIPLIGPMAIAKIARLTAQCDAVLIHDTLYSTSIASYVIAKVLRRPIMLMMHLGGARFNNTAVTALYRIGESLFTRPMLGGSDQVMFISDLIKNHFDGPLYHQPPIVTFASIDDQLFYPPKTDSERSKLRSTFGFGNKNTVLYVGRFVDSKGIMQIRDLAVSRPDLEFALAGWGPIDPRDWKLPNIRVFTSLSRNEISDLYRASDVFVLLSISESLSLVVREALACGLPVVCGPKIALTDSSISILLNQIPVRPESEIFYVEDISSAIDSALKRKVDTDLVSGIIRNKYGREQLRSKLTLSFNNAMRARTTCI